MAYLALESFETRYGRRVRFTCESQIGNEIFTNSGFAVGGLYVPFSSLLIERGAVDVLVVDNVFLDVPFLGHVFEVPTNLFSCRIFLGEGVVAPEFLVVELVDWDGTVDTSTRIAVLRKL